MGPAGEPTRHDRGMAVPYGPPEHRLGQSVNLEVEDAGDSRDVATAGALGDSLDHAQGVGLVVTGAKDGLDDDGHRGRDERDGKRRPE